MRARDRTSADAFDESELPEIKSMAERALTLQPNLPEAHIALGTVYYYGYRQYQEALAEFSRALQLRPNSSQALQYLGFVHRRQGKLELALEELTKALEQNPRDAALAGNRADIYRSSNSDCGISREISLLIPS